ncbi:hypothetical protein [Janthinobacterium tructae]
MMDAVITALVVGKKVANFDADIFKLINAEQGTMAQVRDERMQFGIRNEDGDIYRAIGITGPGVFLQTIQNLVDFGLVDELQHQNGTREGYDAIFSRR